MTARAGHVQKPTHGVAPELRSTTIVGTDGIASVHLTLAVCDYEHVREIAQGLVRADGITLTPSSFHRSRRSPSVLPTRSNGTSPSYRLANIFR